MTFRVLKPAAALLFLTLPALLAAQTTAPSGDTTTTPAENPAEEARLEKILEQQALAYVPKNKVSVGFRVLNSGGKVSFGNLGIVDFDLTTAPISDGIVDRVYDNGSVRTDAPRINERDDNNIQTSVPGQRYATFTTNPVDVLDANGNVIGTTDVQQQTGDFLSYTPGVTRTWGYGADSQVTADGHIALSTYSSTSDGASALKKAGIASGVEFQMVHSFSTGSKRVQWGLLTGVTLTGINNKTAGDVNATLHVQTDYYSLLGAAAPAITDVTVGYTAPSYVDYLDANGLLITSSGQETTTPIAAVPDSSSGDIAIPGGVSVKGIWQVKGAYFLMRVGPTLNLRLSERFGLNASLGVAGAYVGTTYSALETFEVPDLPNVLVGTSVGLQENTATKFLSGYFADLNLEWSANEVTGLFTGLSAQKLSDYSQTVGGRTALIDLGNAVGLRAGISIKF